MILVPKLQFEIRYDPILNFPWVIKDAIAGYTKTSTKLQISRENTVNERLTFYNSDEYYEMHILWDRAFITIQGEFEVLNENNSLIQEPFLNMVDKIKQINTFNNIKHFIVNVIFVKLIDDNIETIVKNFRTKYLNESGISGFQSPSDYAIIIEKRNSTYEERVIFGPYKGKADLDNHEISIINPKLDTLINNVGEMLEINSFNVATSVTFKDFKTVMHKINQTKELLLN